MLFQESTFHGGGFHLLFLEIPPGWWLFPGFTRQGFVNSARAAEVEGRPHGQWETHNDSGKQDGGGLLSVSFLLMFCVLVTFGHSLYSVPSFLLFLHPRVLFFFPSSLSNMEWRLMKAVTPKPVQWG